MIFNCPQCGRVFSPFAAPEGCLCPECGTDCYYQAEIQADEQYGHDRDELERELMADAHPEWSYQPRTEN